MAQHAAAQPVILSNGASYDPAHLQEWKDALPPAEQQMMAELRARHAERRAQRPGRRPR